VTAGFADPERDMGDDFGDFAKAVADYKVAEREGNEVVERIKNILSPLYGDWSRYYLSGLPDETPHIFTKLGSPVNRKPIYVGSLSEDLGKLQSSMTKCAEAMEMGMAASGRIPADLRASLALPPWHLF
jgi:hypothetical protein